MNSEHLEQLRGHLFKSAVHHDTLRKLHSKLQKTHSKIADHTQDATIAELHRDMSAHHRALADAHQERQADFEALREKLAAGSGANVLDSHEGETRDMHNASGNAFLHAAGFLSQDDMIAKTLIRR